MGSPAPTMSYFPPYAAKVILAKVENKLIPNFASHFYMAWVKKLLTVGVCGFKYVV